MKIMKKNAVKVAAGVLSLLMLTVGCDAAQAAKPEKNAMRAIMPLQALNTAKSETGEPLLFQYESAHGVKKTAERIESELKKRDIPVFAKFDHGENAEKAGLSLRPTEVIVFGAPAVGTRLMQENQSISIELPLKISVWEDEAGKVWAAFPAMKRVAAEYGMKDNPILEKMHTLLVSIVSEAASD